MYIGVISNFLVFPINLIIITLFKKSRARQVRMSPIQQALEQQQTADNASSGTDDPKQTQLVDCSTPAARKGKCSLVDIYNF